MKLLGQNLELESCAMHVAPGGSIVAELTGDKTTIGNILRELREEIAWGLVDAGDADNGVRAAIYFGAADLDSFNDVIARVKNADAVKIDKSDVAEGEKRDAYSMTARNKILNCLV